jgi:polyisoprenoid-binding protein YceI
MDPLPESAGDDNLKGEHLMKRLGSSFLAIVFSAIVAGSAAAETFVIDDVHSSVGFTIRHMVGRVTGNFDKFSGTFDYEPGNPKKWKTEATIDAASINTRNTKRDDHLRNADFFDVQKYPTLTFKSTGVAEAKENSAKLNGYLTMHGVTKPVVLNLEFTGITKDTYAGANRAGVVATTQVKRSDFGVGKPADAMLGDEVDIVINLQGLGKKK